MTVDGNNNINAKFADYSKKSGIEASKLEKAAQNVDINWSANSGKTFDTQNGLSKNEFATMMNSVSNKDAESIKNDVNLLFNALDTDGNGELSTQELSVFNGDGSKIQTYDLMHTLGQVSASNIANYNVPEIADDDDIEIEGGVSGMQGMEIITPENGDVTTVAGGINVNDALALVQQLNGGNGNNGDINVADAIKLLNTLKETGGSNVINGINIDEVLAVLQNEGGNPVNIVLNGNGSDFKSNFKSESEAVRYLESFAGEKIETYEDAISYLKSTGVEISESDKEYIEAAILKETLTPEEKTKVDNLLKLNNTMSYYEAAESLKNAGTIDSDISPLSKNMKTGETQLSREERNDALQSMIDAEIGIGPMHKNNKEINESIDDILYNKNMTNSDMARLSVKYTDEHGSFVDTISGVKHGHEDVERAGSHDTKKDIKQYASMLVEGANAGDKNAIKALSKEMHACSHGDSSNFENQSYFVNYVLKNASDEVLIAINDDYKETNNTDESFMKETNNFRNSVLIGFHRDGLRDLARENDIRLRQVLNK